MLAEARRRWPEIDRGIGDPPLSERRSEANRLHQLGCRKWMRELVAALAIGLRAPPRSDAGCMCHVALPRQPQPGLSTTSAKVSRGLSFVCRFQRPPHHLVERGQFHLEPLAPWRSGNPAWQTGPRLRPGRGCRNRQVVERCIGIREHAVWPAHKGSPRETADVRRRQKSGPRGRGSVVPTRERSARTRRRHPRGERFKTVRGARTRRVGPAMGPARQGFRNATPGSVAPATNAEISHLHWLRVHYNVTLSNAAIACVAFNPLPVSTKTVVCSAAMAPASSSFTNAAAVCAAVGST